MENYGHGLAALGDVAKRTGPSASVRVLPRGDMGHTHVRTEDPGHPDEDDAAPAPRGGRRPYDYGRRSTGNGPGHVGPVPPPEAAGQSWLSGLRDRATAAPGDEQPDGSEQDASSAPPAAGETSFDDAGRQRTGADRPTVRGSGGWTPTAPQGRHVRGSHETTAGAGEPLAVEALPTGSVVVARPQLSISPDELRRQATVRRLSVGAVAILGVLAIVTAAVLMTGTSSPKATPRTAAHTHTPPTSVVTSTTRETTTTAAGVTPISVSGNDLTFKVPSGHYTLSFSGVGGACWVGIETGLGSGTYLWNETVPSGITGSYKASGPLAVALGAPEFVAVTVNGVPVKIPKGVTAYNLVFAAS